MLSFDEFHAINERKRSQKSEKARTDDDSSSDQVSSKAPPDSSNNSASSTTKSSFGLGDFLEMHETQTVLLVLLVMDTFAAFTEVAAIETVKHIQSNTMELFFKLLESFTSFTVFFFALEIFALFLAFRLRFIIHLGYLLDCAIIGVQLYCAVQGYGLECRILNMFRFWRLARLFQSMVNVEKEAHRDTQALVEGLRTRKKALEDRLKAAQEDLKKEQEARVSVEDMLQGYKEEVDTLNEALKIAAMDIAEVAEAEDEFFMSDDEDDDDLQSASAGLDTQSVSVGSESFASTGGQRRKEELYREVLKDSAATGQAAVSAPSSKTFVVKEDGTFEKK